MDKDIAVQLFTLLTECFDMGYKNPFIRWLYSDGIDIVIDDVDNMTTRYYQLDSKILTNQFLNDVRRLHQRIIA